MRSRRCSSSEQANLSNVLPSARIIALNVVIRPGANAPIPVTKGRPSQDDGVALKERLLALAASNRKLQRTIRQNTAIVADLKNALDSTDVATILLDVDLNIRFVTPAARLILDVTVADIGRPLAGLSSLAPDEALLGDANDVLQTLEPIEREIEARSGAWYIRRILPLRTGGKGIEGVAITFADITRRKEMADALERAKSQADAANAAKSRFLAAARHDLRQPLQTLVLLQELLAKAAVGDKAQTLVGRLGETLDGMTGMLNGLLDINQIEAGAVHTEVETFRIDAVLEAAAPPAPRAVTAEAIAPVVFVVDDDAQVRRAVRGMLEGDGRIVEDYEDAEAFLDAYRPGRKACLLIDANLPGIGGIDLLKRLKDAGHPVPAIMITGHSDVPMAVEAMKAGASDFLEKPIRGTELLAGIARALEQASDSGKLTSWRKNAADHLAGLTRRQYQIMEMVLAGHPSKNIAADLGISRRTVENHRASIMKRTESRSLPALVRLALAAAWNPDGGPAAEVRS